MANKAQIETFVRTMLQLGRQVQKERNCTDASLFTCIAQACLESGYGTSAKMKNAHAYFGVKATRTWINNAKYGGLVYNTKTKECYDGKNYVSINDCFRAYSEDIDSIRDYYDLMVCQRYKKSLSAETVRECITIIKNGGYATAPNYIEQVISVYNTIKPYLNDEKKTEPSQKYKVIAKTGLNIRSGAGTNYSKIGILAYGSIFTKEKEQNGWIKPVGRNGWLCAKYLQKI